MMEVDWAPETPNIQRHQLYQSPSPAQSIPSELISYILQFLTHPHDMLQSALTCRAWTFNALEALWWKPQFRSTAHWLAFCQILGEPRAWSYPYSTFVRRINVSSLSTNVNDHQLMLLNQCDRIERITLIGCTSLTDTGLLGLLSNKVGHYVTSVDLSDITTITNATIFKIAATCPNLQGLNLSMCREDQQRCTGVTDQSICRLAEACPQLRRIKLNNCDALTEKSALALAHHCPRLLEIDCPVNDQVLAEVWSHLRELREYRLAQHEPVTDAAFHPFYVSVPSDMDDHYRRLVAQRLRPPLEAKDGYFDQLRMLDLSNAAFISDEAVRVIVHAAPKIRNLVLNKCKEITDEGVLSICRLGRFLHYLHLGHCELLTDHSIIKLAHACTRIRYIDLAQCSNLTNDAVVALATLPRLKRIGLVKCFNISDTGIDAFSQNPRMASSLERVHLSYCVKLSEASIRRLLNFCYRLNHLSLTHVPAFLRPELLDFRRPPPKTFSQQQRNVFCVYSGHGVKDLRVYLNKTSTQPSQPPPSPPQRRPFQLPANVMDARARPPALDLPQTADGSPFRLPFFYLAPANPNDPPVQLAPHLLDRQVRPNVTLPMEVDPPNNAMAQDILWPDVFNVDLTPLPRPAPVDLEEDVLDEQLME
ncbi:RNI-like protein [Hesseltinella vesiculosa]|uniref:RNI-like protein n=1 Tax=Hesseltinella vesiculosa TaxID=101127 RepID=A0A1X2GJ51_9FUNG|nr:RNI-like protein [Hesseltinella vesiculosa]